MPKIDEELIVNILRSRLSGISTVFLFGSAARGEMKMESDLDIAFIGSEVKKYNKEKLFEIKNELSQRLSFDIDLIDMNNAGSIINFQILKNGKVIFQDHKAISEFEKFKIKELGKYYDFKIERKEAEQNILKKRIID